MNRHRVIATLALAAILLTSASALAYKLKKENGKDCDQSGDTCVVYCNNGQRAGSMNWNGSVWTDAVRSDKDKDVVARAIVAADGTACQ